jgi:hypothetical protein
MRGYADANADTIFRDLIDMSATITVAADEVTVRFIDEPASHHHRLRDPCEENAASDTLNTGTVP